MLILPSSFLCVQLTHFSHHHQTYLRGRQPQFWGQFAVCYGDPSPLAWLKKGHVTRFWLIRWEVKSAEGSMAVSSFLEKRHRKACFPFSRCSHDWMGSGGAIAFSHQPGSEINSYNKEDREPHGERWSGNLTMPRLEPDLLRYSCYMR